MDKKGKNIRAAIPNACSLTGLLWKPRIIISPHGVRGAVLCDRPFLFFSSKKWGICLDGQWYFLPILPDCYVHTSKPTHTLDNMRCPPDTFAILLLWPKICLLKRKMWFAGRKRRLLFATAVWAFSAGEWDNWIIVGGYFPVCVGWGGMGGRLGGGECSWSAGSKFLPAGALRFWQQRLWWPRQTTLMTGDGSCFWSLRWDFHKMLSPWRQVGVW